MSTSDGAATSQGRLSDQAYRQIRDAIIGLRLEPGAPLVDRALSEWLGIGLTPVRDALKRLTLERLAVSYPARGTYVSPINIADASALNEVRVQLEGLAAIHLELVDVGNGHPLDDRRLGVRRRLSRRTARGRRR